jgi:DNA segregation ATPase FtsK/SpoIIIE, S-DNA-T family
MSTWGASKKRSSSTSKKSSSAGRNATGKSASASATGKSASAKGPAKASGNVRDATPPEGSGSRRDQATAELREAVGGREHEFLGLGLIGLAVLLGLAVYVNLAGPLGRGVETLAGWLFGLGRYAVPVVLVAVGVSFVRKGRSASPFQLVIGWSMMSLAVLGLLQVARGSDRLGDAADGIDQAGGWVGALVGTPLEALLATAGAAVLLVLVFTGVAGVTRRGDAPGRHDGRPHRHPLRARARPRASRWPG